MKIVESIEVISKGPFSKSPEWSDIRKTIHNAVITAAWPPGSKDFVIHPQSGKKSNEGNGVVPIKAKPMDALREQGWTLEHRWSLDVLSGKNAERPRKGARPGDIDAAKLFAQGLVVVEWETGNVSSSHRALNKMALGLVREKCIAGVLIIPNMRLAQYLTDRIGNIEEIRPYFPMWQRLEVSEGVLEVVVIEQDGESIEVPKIPKGKDGRAFEGASKLSKRENDNS